MATIFFSSALILTIVLSLLTIIPVTTSLQLRFYQKSCPQAESIVKRIVKNNFQKDPSIPGGLIRLHFHDCFIRGCDGSVLTDSEGDNVAEKEAPPNLSLRGFEIIDEIKLELEKHWQGVVSCADILALATRDSVASSGGLVYMLPTGRRDGTISRMADVHCSYNLYAGAHSIGLCHCGFLIDRLYNLKGGQTNQVFNLSQDPTVFMNPSSNTNFKLDSAFYSSVIDGKALLQLDQGLAFTDLTSKLATRYVNEPQLFRKKFAKAMIKLGNIGVSTAEQGEVRLNC
ncbi:hypothetical protein MKX01_014147 [Papaver californicum]|nr:hypothetical protein MKX01_014147 [Papaver californicum]